MLYIVSKIDEEYQKHTEYVINKISNLIKEEIFFPHKHNPFNLSHDKIDYEVFLV